VSINNTSFCVFIFYLMEGLLSAKESETWFVCPYEMNHTILNSRIAIHMSTCKSKQQYSKIQVYECVYNNSHLVFAENEAVHSTHCKSCKSRAPQDPPAIALEQDPIFSSNRKEKETYCRACGVVISMAQVNCPHCFTLHPQIVFPATKPFLFGMKVQVSPEGTPVHKKLTVEKKSPSLGGENSSTNNNNNNSNSNSNNNNNRDRERANSNSNRRENGHHENRAANLQNAKTPSPPLPASSSETEPIHINTNATNQNREVELGEIPTDFEVYLAHGGEKSDNNKRRERARDTHGRIENSLNSRNLSPESEGETGPNGGEKNANNNRKADKHPLNLVDEGENENQEKPTKKIRTSAEPPFTFI